MMRCEDPAASIHGRAPRVWAFVGKYGTVMVLFGMIVAFSVAEPQSFPTVSNMRGILSQVALTAIIAGGMTFPLVVGEFDLSIGYQAKPGRGRGRRVTGQPTPAGLDGDRAVLLMGVAIGTFNGVLVTRLGVNALIATLGVGTVLIGLTYGYTSGIPIALPPDSAFSDIALGSAILGSRT